MANPLNPYQFSLPGFEYTYLEDKNEWIWKAVPFQKPERAVSEVPHLKVIEDIERDYKSHFDKMIGAASRDIAKYLIG